MKYAQIIFLQNSEANEPLNILNEFGPDAAIDHLSVWDDGVYCDLREDTGAGTQDRSYETKRYVLTYNTHLNYIGLCVKLPNE